MKKVMSILTVAAFLIGAAVMVSFTVKENSSDPLEGWYYVNPSNENQADNPVLESEPQCGLPSEIICARKFHMDGGTPTTPDFSSQPVYGERE